MLSHGVVPCRARKLTRLVFFVDLGIFYTPRTEHWTVPGVYRLFYFICLHFFFPDTFTFQLLDRPWSSQVSSLLPLLGSCLQFFIAHRVKQSHCCSSIFHRVLLTHALALSASEFVHKNKSSRIYTSVHSVGLELTKLTYTRLEDNLIRHRADRSIGNTQVGTRTPLGPLSKPRKKKPATASRVQNAGRYA